MITKIHLHVPHVLNGSLPHADGHHVLPLLHVLHPRVLHVHLHIPLQSAPLLHILLRNVHGHLRIISAPDAPHEFRHGQFRNVQRLDLSLPLLLVDRQGNFSTFQCFQVRYEQEPLKEAFQQRNS